MPLYEYHCEPCEVSRDVRHPITEEPEVVCEACGEPMERLIAAVSFRLHGHWQGEHTKDVDRQLKRQEARLKQKVEEGELTEEDVEKMADIRDKYAKDSPYVFDPTKDGKQDPNPEEAGTGFFDDQLEI